MDTQLSDWSDKLVFGIDTIDAQHKQLFDLAATFEGKGDQIRMMKTLAELCNYVLEHFREEEELLTACGYPGLEEHRVLHRRFRGMIVELLGEARTMTLDQVAERVHYLINGWFYNHIMVTDLDYVPLVRAHLAATGRGAAGNEAAGGGLPSPGQQTSGQAA
jgi:hemerythrin-like metal-binding protein